MLPKTEPLRGGARGDSLPRPELESLEHTRSAFVRLVAVQKVALTDLGFETLAFKMWDLLVNLCSRLVDYESEAPWYSRLEACFEDSNLDELMPMLEAVREETYKGWLKKIKSREYQKYVRRLLGSGSFDLLKAALFEDLALFALVSRGAVRAMVPFCAAMQDAMGVLQEADLQFVPGVDVASLHVLDLAIKGELSLNCFIKRNGPSLASLDRSNDSWAGDAEMLEGLARRWVSVSARRKVRARNAHLARKMRGAREALLHSVDGVSQAANSIIELIDRLLRSYPDAYVLNWVDKYVPDAEEELSYLVEDTRRPTKRAQALCLLSGGMNVMKDEHGSRIRLLELPVDVVLTARKNLQRIKHADDGSAGERAEVAALLTGVEAALMLLLTIGDLRVHMAQEQQAQSA